MANEFPWISIADDVPPESKMGDITYLVFKSPTYGILFGMYRDGKFAKDFSAVYDCDISHFAVVGEIKYKNGKKIGY